MALPVSRKTSLLLVDDDDLSRELLLLLAVEYGFAAESVSSGEEALRVLRAAPVDAVLADLHMPGLHGQALGRALRQAHPGAVLLAMSASSALPDVVAAFDGFLLKPFGMEEVDALISRPQPASRRGSSARDAILNPQIYAGLQRSLTADKLQQLYALCLDDAERRVRLMYAAAAARDQGAWVRIAHAVKGGCGMVGATELAALAGGMESSGLPPVGNTAPLDDFLAAAARLRDMLDAQTT